MPLLDIVPYVKKTLNDVKELARWCYFLDKIKIPTRKEIVRLMNQLPSKIEGLLKKYSKIDPIIFVPDYISFSFAANKLIKPFAVYADAMFHTGGYSDVYRLALRVFAAKKMEYEHFLFEQSLPGDTDKVVDIFMRSKLLRHFFQYQEEEYPHNLKRLVDLEYQFEHEKDPHKRQVILEEFTKMKEESSTGLHAKAILAFNEGDFDRALALCKKAIEKFPGNTPTYKLKADIHQAIARKTLEEGLQKEPRDQTLRLAFDIEGQLWKLREKCANGLLDLETAVDHLERLIQEEIKNKGVDLKPYEEEVKKSIQSFKALQPRTIKQSPKTTRLCSECYCVL